MSIGLASDFQIYHEQFIGGFVETIQQNVDGFNESSAGALRLAVDGHLGDYNRESFYDVISGLITRRDTSSNATVTDTPITTDEFIGVKRNYKAGPVAQSLDAWRKIGKDQGEMSFVLGQQMAMALPQTMLEACIMALEGKLDAVAALEHDATDGTLATTDLVSGLAKAGDKANGIVAWVSHSKPYFDLLGNQISNAIYRADGVMIMEGTPATLGRPVFLTDSASLVETDGVSSGVDAYSTLALFAGAASCTVSEPPTAVMDLVTGNENITYRYQAEGAYTVQLRGCEWNTGSGANPTDAALATGSNWTTQVADNKLLPGAILKTR